MDRIPKKLHLYWDNSPMSRLQVFTVETFHKLNPDWDIFVYTPIQSYFRNEQYIPNYLGNNYFSLLKDMDYVKIIPINIDDYGISVGLHNILRSDIFRYHILYNEGGVWSDFDVIWIKSIEYMSDITYIGSTKIQDMGATACFFDGLTGHQSIGVLFSAVGHLLYKELIEESFNLQNFPDTYPSFYYDKVKRSYNHQAFGVLLWEYLYKTFSDIVSKYTDIVGLKYETIMPYSIFDLDRLYKKNDVSVINENVIGVHWFNGHKLSKDYINNDLFTKNYTCSMTTILRREGYVK